MLIAVSGNIGSGKTTLARYIAENYKFHYVPQHRFEFNFLDDFFEDIEGKFLPAQLSFLISKAIEIHEFHKRKWNIIVDRSLLEDVKVFARLWIENKTIDPKIVNLYQNTAAYIIESLPDPDLYLMCRCPANISAHRISQRPKRKFEEKYPDGHIQMLERYYSELSFGNETPYVEIDTTCFDFTKEEVLRLLCADIFDGLQHGMEYGQLSFFERSVPDKGKQCLIFHNYYQLHTNTDCSKLQKESGYIYMAAPFTQFATEFTSDDDSNQEYIEAFRQSNDSAPYGVIPPGYRKILINIEKALRKKYETDVLLPHRDINNWGKTVHSADYLTPRIIEGVENASMFVAIPGSSTGVHMELGVAIAKKIPIIIFEPSDLPKSFFAEGFLNLPYVTYFKVKSLTQIPSCIESEQLG